MSYEESDATPDADVEHPIPLGGIGCFKDRLQEGISAHSLRGFSRLCGLSEATLRSYLSGHTYPTLDRLLQIAEAAGKDPQWLAFGKKGTQQTPSASAEEFVYVEQMSISGQGLIQRRHAVRRDWLLAQGLDPARLSILETRDTSMAPTMQPGDLLLCETYFHRNENRIEQGLAPGELPPQDGIYFIRFQHSRADSTAFRRLRLDMTGGFFLYADADTSMHLHMQEGDLARLCILARVVQLQRQM